MYREDLNYSSKTSSEEEEEAWENENTTKKKANKKMTMKKKTTTVVTMEQRTQLDQLSRPVSIMVAWDKPKKKNSPP